MSETGYESYAPGEGESGAPEQLSEEARQRFAAAGAAMQAARREEKKSKKKDSRVAKTIVRFLNDDRYTHLFVLISRLVGRDCPSIFILAILSLIDEECQTVVREHLQEVAPGMEAVQPSVPAVATTALGEQTNRDFLEWITRMQMVLSLEPSAILQRLMVDEHNIDGTVLQLTAFILQEYFRSERGGQKEPPFEKLHIFAANILQTVFEPFMDAVDRSLLQGRMEVAREDDDE